MTATPKRVKMKWGPGDAPEPTTHDLATPGSEDVWFAAATAQGEQIHFAYLICQHVQTGETIPYAICDQADDVLPDPGKFVLSGGRRMDLLTCERCKELLAQDFDPKAVTE